MIKTNAETSEQVSPFRWLALTLPIAIPDEEKKINKIFIFTLLCGASKGFIRALMAFIKPFEAPKRSVKIKIQLNFFFNRTFRNARDVRV